MHKTARIQQRFAPLRNALDELSRRFVEAESLASILISDEVIVNLIAARPPKPGWKFTPNWTPEAYPPGTKVSDQQVKQIDLRRHQFQ